MFYWNYKNDEIESLTEELLNCGEVQSIRIATAFLSGRGISVLRKMQKKYNISRSDIVLYLSCSFSMNKPHELLKELKDICQARLVFSRKFHPKVYLLQGNENKLIFGSANFTYGGLEENIEFGSVIRPDRHQLEMVQNFFSYCEEVSIPLEEEIIAFYKESEADFARLHKEQQRVQRKLCGYL
ncbi:MAG: phospholipase D family protein [Eubacteriales bacterium]|nr:phospholipase D family protein [Eubacteriales bacterium]MDD4390455.1 phospholipase D family protein [Eubacteriales bacterium]